MDGKYAIENVDPLSSVVVLVALHHHLKFFVDFVVLGFGPRRQRVIGGVDILTGTVRTATAILVLFLVQCLMPRNRHKQSNPTSQNTKI